MKRRSVETKEQLIDVLAELQSGKIDNDSASRYIEALSAWLVDCDGFYKNIGEARDTDTADWQLIADALCAAAVYE